MASVAPVSLSRGILLVRHGETSLNAAGLLRGRLDPPLTERGAAQARALAAELESFDLRLVVASPLRRALETASAVANRVGLPVILDDDFNDRDYGPWAGKSLANVNAQWGGVDDAPGVESRAVVVERALRGLRRVSNDLEIGVAIVVTHDAIIRALLNELDPRISHTVAQRTGCYNVIDLSSIPWRIVSVNSIPRGSP